METWLLKNGFHRLKGGMSGHVQYERRGVKITLPGHGPQDLTKKHVALILRALDGAGFDRERVRRERWMRDIPRSGRSRECSIVEYMFWDDRGLDYENQLEGSLHVPIWGGLCRSVRESVSRAQ